MNAPALELLDVDTARAATDRLRLTLTDAHEQLLELFRRRAHEALGYGRGTAGWSAYCAAEFGDLLHVKPTPEQLAAMVDGGMTQRQAAAPFAVSLGTVNAAVRSHRVAGAGADTPVGGAPSPLDRGEPATLPAHVQAARVVAAAGAAGLTIPQVQRRLGWTPGATSGALSRAERQGLVRRPLELPRRGVYRPYVGTAQGGAL